MKPSDPKGLLFPSAERGLADTKRFLIRVTVLETDTRLKVYDDFLKTLANQNRHFKALITKCKNGNQSKILESHSQWCINSSVLTVRARAEIERG